jgi:hypothetical protein
MEFVILAHIDDETALRVGALLRARHGPERVALVSAEELVFAARWAHRLDGASAITELRLASGVELNSHDIGVVFNRLRHVDLPHFAAATAEDRSYAVTETYAFWLSWLASLPCPVVNPATARGLGAQERSHAEWLLLAGRAGLPARAYHFTSDPRRYSDSQLLPYERVQAPSPDGVSHYERAGQPSVSRRPAFYLEPVAEARRRALVVGERVLGAPDEAYCAPLRQLAAAAGCDLLEASFARAAGDGAWRVCDISPLPRAVEGEAARAIGAHLEAKLAGAEVRR